MSNPQAIVQVSGQTVVLASGFHGVVALTDDGGVSRVSVGGLSDAYPTGTISLATQGFIHVWDAEGGFFSRVRANKSGQGALAVATSGSDYIVVASGLYITNSGQGVITAKAGETLSLFSGYGATNSYVYSGTGFLNHEKATIMLECIELGSGVAYTIRGYVISGVTPYCLASGSLISGQVEVETLGDPYEYVDVGIKALQTTQSGAATVFMALR